MEQRAAFNPLIRPYLILYVAGFIALSIVGIPLLIFWFLGVGQWWARHYFERLECVLTDRLLRYRKGILVQVEKTIPLENIQDVTFVEGPLLKKFNLAILKFETAGQSTGQAHDMRLVGIINAQNFRNMILEARDRLKHIHAPQLRTADPESEQLAVLREIQQDIRQLVRLLTPRAEPTTPVLQQRRQPAPGSPEAESLP